jgi:glucosamine 6-phosphate synthetase-like amidotransferase/phosphosugar isomerase protein
MGGIIGYVGRQPCERLLLEGLRKLGAALKLKEIPCVLSEAQARGRGFNVDQARDLAKTVTVE